MLSTDIYLASLITVWCWVKLLITYHLDVNNRMLIYLIKCAITTPQMPWRGLYCPDSKSPFSFYPFWIQKLLTSIVKRADPYCNTTFATILHALYFKTSKVSQEGVCHEIQQFVDRDSNDVEIHLAMLALVAIAVGPFLYLRFIAC